MTLRVLRSVPLADESRFTPGGRGWVAPDGMAPELECAELLWALIRAAKPRLVVEGGAGSGFASLAMASALADNGWGCLVAYEPDAHWRERASARLRALPAEVRPGSTLDHRGEHPGLVFLDSGPQTRSREIDRWLGCGVLLVVHDARRYPALEGRGVLVPTPRGVWIGG